MPPTSHLAVDESLTVYKESKQSYAIELFY